MTIVKNMKENAVIVGVALKDTSREELNSSMEELKQLSITAGANVVEVISQNLASINPSTYIGKGKVEELAKLIKEKEIQLAIFDDELSPAQASKLEKIIECAVIDRKGLILDIFALHARSRESKIQVELAQLKYMLPRLRGQWTHLERQEGAIGTRGPGETQLETDRRAIRIKISKLEKDLDKIDSQRNVRRAGRSRLKMASLIGYTNAGKSTLLNALTGADALVEDQLFATLDTTVRRVDFDNGSDILLSDTVGFIKKLPHELVASFRSTFSEAIEADLLLHVIDTSQPNFEEQMEAVTSVLHEIKITDKPIIYVFNKMDIIDSAGRKEALLKNYPDGVFISASKKTGLNELLIQIRKLAFGSYIRKTLSIPLSEGKILASIYNSGRVLNRIEANGKVEITFEASPEIVSIIMKSIDNAEKPN
ncbi:MAG: GTPase HflX [Candidatus Marinimicrobia bacterium]|nr:GTPase HflX [Candidatus Neomarinimicrobiota bacterium]